MLKDSSQGQKFFVAVAGMFLLFLLVVAVYRSNQRVAVISFETEQEGSQEAEAVAVKPKEESKLELEDFHRVKVEEGKPVWEVKGKDAKFFPKEQVTHVNDVFLKIYRENRNPVEIESRAAKLFIAQLALNKAELEGEIVVSVEDQFLAETQLAVYDSLQRRISAPEQVEIKGDGFFLQGNELEIELETERFWLKSNVWSVFKPKTNGEVLSR